MFLDNLFAYRPFIGVIAFAFPFRNQPVARAQSPCPRAAVYLAGVHSSGGESDRTADGDGGAGEGVGVVGGGPGVGCAVGP